MVHKHISLHITYVHKHISRRYKFNLVNCLLDRAYKICNSYASICSEMDTIKGMLGRNGYPAYFLDVCVREFFDRKYKMLRMLCYSLIYSRMQYGIIVWALLHKPSYVE